MCFLYAESPRAMEKQSAITITQQPEDYAYTPSGPAWFTVTASGTGLTYRWQYSTDYGDTWVNSANGTAGNQTLYMTTVSDFQLSVIWRCIVTDATGHTAVTQTAGYRDTTSTAPLVITDQPDNYYCAIGDSAQFTTVASGAGLSCRWQYSQDDGVSWHNSGKSTAIYGTLVIDAVDEYHMSLLWRCKVMDSSGNVVYSRIVSCKRSTTRWRNVYDLDGLRAKRTNGETTYLYTYLDGQLTHMKVDGQHYYFTYDPNGTPLAMTWNGANYYYVTNLQGDITHILDNTGAVVTSYVYNAWGKLISTTGTLASTVGRYNPLRYRGYVYDTETGLYYLQSRYYNPETGRFVNADGMAATGQGILGNNMFAYCGNNPVCRQDPAGQFWLGALLAGLAFLGVAVCTSGCESQSTSNVGAASPYMASSSQKYNCYAYALGETEWKYVGGYKDAVNNYDVEVVAGMVLADAQRDGKSIRPIDTYDSPIESNEYRIALRTGANDYHFMVQHDDGTWSHKPGNCKTRLINGDNPSVVSWDAPIIDLDFWKKTGLVKEIGYEHNYYDSMTLYFAVSK